MKCSVASDSRRKGREITPEALRIVEAVDRAETALHRIIPEEIWLEVFFYAKRKLSYLGKPESYFPILFENELRDFYTRRAINLRGEINRVQYLYEMPV